MISFRQQTNGQKCRGYVPRYERTPKNGGVVIHSVFSTHVETIVLLQKSDRKLKPDTHVRLSLDMKDYYRIKDAEGDVKIE